MNIIRLCDLGADPRSQMQNARWLILTHEELEIATTALMLSELEDVLVAVDHRGAQPNSGLWMRATHLLIVDGDVDARTIQISSGITHVVAHDTVSITNLLW